MVRERLLTLHADIHCDDVCFVVVTIMSCLDFCSIVTQLLVIRKVAIAIAIAGRGMRLRSRRMNGVGFPSFLLNCGDRGSSHKVVGS